MPHKPVVLIIRDGWGENHDSSLDRWNAVKNAEKPVADTLTTNWPRTEIQACGLDVGLPDGIMGNSEVGHQNIGAGRIVDQELVRIDKAISTGAVSHNEVFQKALERIRKGGRLHLMGLVSDAGVHAMLEHLYGLLRVCAENQISEVFIHAFTDGRDTPPTTGLGFIEQLEAQCAKTGVGRIASIGGRFWAMDRDLRWDRVEKAYAALTGQAGRTSTSATDAVRGYYADPLDASRKGDEFIVPTMITDDTGKPLAPISNGDAVVFFNFRGDRPRELTRAFTEENF
jgi:2,3-bisphosphoglycerate-independent phosphoglycerate mutase